MDTVWWPDFERCVAPAAQADADCPGGYVCLFTDGNFGGEVFYVPDGGSIDHLQDYHCDGCISSTHPESNGTYDNMMSSWKNFPLLTGRPPPFCRTPSLGSAA